jgi:hypothetical protein
MLTFKTDSQGELMKRPFKTRFQEKLILAFIAASAVGIYKVKEHRSKAAAEAPYKEDSPFVQQVKEAAAFFSPQEPSP